MPYRTNTDLPASVQNHLPPHPPDIFREAFNRAWASHAGEPDVEARAARIARGAAKHCSLKAGPDRPEENTA